MDKKDIIIILLILILLYFGCCYYNNNERFTPILTSSSTSSSTTSSITDTQRLINTFNETIEGRIDTYLSTRADISITESIKNLGLIAQHIQNTDGNLVIPANVQIRGKLSVINDIDDSEVLSTDNYSLKVNNLQVKQINGIDDNKININSQIISNEDINIMRGKELNLFDLNNNFLSRTSLQNVDNNFLIKLYGDNQSRKFLIRFEDYDGNKNRYEFNKEELKCGHIQSIDNKVYDINNKAFIMTVHGGQIVTISPHSDKYSSIVNTGRQTQVTDRHMPEWVTGAGSSPLILWGQNIRKHEGTGMYVLNTNIIHARWWLH